MLDYNSKIGILMTRLALLDEVVADSGMKMAILRTTDGDVAFFVVNAENIDEIIFQHTVERARLSAEEPADIAGSIADELFALLAQYDEAREEGHMSRDEEMRGITPWLGDTRPKNKGGKAASRTLTSLANECKRYRDEMKGFSERASETATEIRDTADRACTTCILSAAVAILANILTIIFYVCA